MLMMMYIQYKIHEIPSSGYLLMAPNGQKDGHGQNYIPPPLAGDNASSKPIVIISYQDKYSGLKYIAGAYNQ